MLYHFALDSTFAVVVRHYSGCIQRSLSIQNGRVWVFMFMSFSCRVNRFVRSMDGSAMVYSLHRCVLATTWPQWWLAIVCCSIWSRLPLMAVIIITMIRKYYVCALTLLAIDKRWAMKLLSTNEQTNTHIFPPNDMWLRLHSKFFHSNRLHNNECDDDDDHDDKDGSFKLSIYEALLSSW